MNYHCQGNLGNNNMFKVSKKDPTIASEVCSTLALDILEQHVNVNIFFKNLKKFQTNLISILLSWNMFLY